MATDQRAATIARALSGLHAFRHGKHLTGEPCTPWNKTPAGQRWADGSIVRVFAGALAERGSTALVGGGSRPGIGELDIAPATGLGLFDADYVIKSYDTPIAWHLGPEWGHEETGGEWVEVAELCNREYGRFSATTTRGQNLIHAAIAALAEEETR